MPTPSTGYFAVYTEMSRPRLDPQRQILGVILSRGLIWRGPIKEGRGAIEDP